MPSRAPRLYVIAGVNGSGKSSVAGAAIRAAGGEYFNPDEATQRILDANPGAPLAVANGAAWNTGRRLLERAIAERLDFACETTLGGTTIPRLLDAAIGQGLDVHMRYVGLEGVALHITRVRARVVAGGHDVPEAKIRERYDTSRRNLIRLVPRLADLQLFDNSADAPPALGREPRPRLLLHTTRGAISDVAPASSVPRWAKPIIMAALRSGGRK